MFLLDTNVLSELKKHPSRQNLQVRTWAKQLRPGGQYLSAVTVMELERGTRLKERTDPEQGARLRMWLEAQLQDVFRRKIFPVDDKVARYAGGLHVPDPRPTNDALIAATAAVHGLTLVTRNVKDFEGAGVTLLNPWEF